MGSCANLELSCHVCAYELIETDHVPFRQNCKHPSITICMDCWKLKLFESKQIIDIITQENIVTDYIRDRQISSDVLYMIGLCIEKHVKGSALITTRSPTETIRCPWSHCSETLTWINM